VGCPQGGRRSLCGSAGCGKTLLSMEVLIRGAVEYDEPGVFMSFEESVKDITENVASLGFNLDRLQEEKKVVLDYVHIDRSEIEENGEYDLEGLFIRLGYAIDSIGAKRVVLDTIENLFGGLDNQAILRAELRRLFRWLKDKGVTAIVTGERGAGQLTRHGLEEYVSDCVILLDHRVNDQVSTRRLRIVKYRGSLHGTNEYPFLIDEKGISVLPITSTNLAHAVSNERLSTGIERLDTMLGGKGVFRGSKHFDFGHVGKRQIEPCGADGRGGLPTRGEGGVFRVRGVTAANRTEYAEHRRGSGEVDPQGTLEIRASRPNHYGLEMHLAIMHKVIEELKPSVVVMDPINNLVAVGSSTEVNAMLTRFIDFLKARGITGVFTSLTAAGSKSLEETDIGMSSLMDTWILLRDIEHNGERSRGIYILKSRGMAHSNQIREFLITSEGLDLVDVYTGPEGVLTGSARMAQEAKLRAAEAERQFEIKRRSALLERRRKTIDAQIAALNAELAAEEQEFSSLTSAEKQRLTQLECERQEMAKRRQAD
jgi:circadian clock protein KaiC